MLTIGRKEAQQPQRTPRLNRGHFGSIGRMAGWAVFALVILLCVLPKGSTRVFTWPWAFYAQLLLIAPIFLCGWHLLTRRRPSDTRHSSAEPGSLIPCRQHVTSGAVIFACALSIGLSVLLSRNPHFSFEAALYLWGALAWSWWLAQRLREHSSSEERFLWTARIAGLALLAPILSSLFHWLSMIGPALVRASTLAEAITAFGSSRNPHPFGHWNYTGAFALIALPWFGSLAWTERGRWRALWIVVAVSCPMLIFSSASRGAVLGALALLITLFAIGFATGRITRRSGLWLLAAGAVVAAFLAFTNVRLRALLTDPSALQYPSLGDVQRLAMLQGGWLLGQERPWLGHGPGMVPFVYPEVRGRLLGGVETSYQLHNAYLHHWVITGMFGVAAGLALALALARGARRWLRQPSSIPRTFALGSTAAITGYAAMAATDYQLDVIGILLALSLPAAMLLAAPQAKRSVERAAIEPRRRAHGVLVLGAGVAAIVFLIPHWRARHLHWTAWMATSENEGSRALEKFFAASQAAPWNTHYRNQLGLQLAQQAQRSEDPDQRALARGALFASLSIDIAQEPIHANAGWLWLPDDPFKAESEFERSLALIPDRDTLYHGLAISRLASGNEAGAVRALAMECLVNPPFIASPLWARPQMSAMQTQVEIRLNELLRLAAEHPDMPRWRQRDLSYFTAFLRWWKSGPAPADSELAGADTSQRAFFQAAAATPQAATQWPAPWRELAATINEEGTMSRTTPGNGSSAAEDGTTARIKAGITLVPELVRSTPPLNVGIIAFTIERGHYPLMHRNLDGPGYLDLAPRVTDAFRQRYAEPLFPPRGLIPGLVLRDIGEPVQSLKK